MLKTPGRGFITVALARYATAPSVRRSLFEFHGRGMFWEVEFAGGAFQFRPNEVSTLLRLELAPETMML